jgi:collagen type I/II/III/V/XI/XXIV/XXVII alpha
MSGTGTTISSSYVNGITLNDTIDNPVTVTGTIAATTGNGLYGIGGPISGGGGALYGWTINNSGTISSGPGNYAAIALGSSTAPVAASTVTNAAAGVISGALNGVYIHGFGSVTNLAGGYITGISNSAVYIALDAGTVANSGTLLGGLYGVDMAQGGTVTNLTGGTITGTTKVGVQVSGIAGTISNQGSIIGGSYGVDELVGGSVTNQSGAVITGTTGSAVDMRTGPGTLVNSGSLLGGFFGVNEEVGGSVTNLSSGVITGTEIEGVRIAGGSGAVDNDGQVTSNYIGVLLDHGGSVINRSGGSIMGNGTIGIDINNAAGTVINSGYVYGAVVGVSLSISGSITNQSGGNIYGGKYGIYMGSGGSLTNQANGTIASGSSDGVLLEAAGTVTNAGTIEAGNPSGTAVQLATSDSVLIVDPGAVFSGVIAGVSSTMELAGTGVGALAGFDGTSITNFASLQFEIGADWTISGDSSVDGLSGISSIGGFNVGDTIDLTDFAATSVAFASNQLVLTDAGDATETLNITGGFQTSDFHIPTDGSSTDITVTATCYAAGTRIRTTRGEVAVENLREGDLVLTVSGRTQPISWIGHRHVNFHGHPNRQRILPVRITAHAFGQGTPERDLLLSPDHAVFVEDVLIPIRHLINGGSIAQIECDTITYYHIELPRHDVLLADGMPAESYLEAGARDAFANVDGVIQLHPDFEPPRDHYAMLWEAEAYAPLVVAGEQLDRARCKLADRAAWPPFGEGVAARPSSPLSAIQCLGLPA